MTDAPGCGIMPGGLMTQNPFDKKWNNMVDGAINTPFLSTYRILQVRTQVCKIFSLIYIY